MFRGFLQLHFVESVKVLENVDPVLICWCKTVSVTLVWRNWMCWCNWSSSCIVLDFSVPTECLCLIMRSVTDWEHWQSKHNEHSAKNSLRCHYCVRRMTHNGNSFFVNYTHLHTFTNTYTVLIFSTESVKRVRPLDSFIYARLHLIYSWKRQIWWKYHQDISKFDLKSVVVSAAPGSPDWVVILLSGAKKQQKIHFLDLICLNGLFHEFSTSLKVLSL